MNGDGWKIGKIEQLTYENEQIKETNKIFENTISFMKSKEVFKDDKIKELENNIEILKENLNIMNFNFQDIYIDLLNSEETLISTNGFKRIVKYKEQFEKLVKLI